MATMPNSLWRFRLLN